MLFDQYPHQPIDGLSEINRITVEVRLADIDKHPHDSTCINCASQCASVLG
ncbi:MAG: hypothetical protein QNL62_15255 [Gammaproteobacteria bacterium]|nr:hypothetical protein [Gammaproteobacteria bacterium]